jgi:dUTP pyrophosphatase
MSVEVLIQRLDKDLPMPRYAKAGDAGIDLYSRIDFTLAPGERSLIPTGVAIALPPGFVALVHPRSVLALKHGISMVNTPGTIDAGYRGEIQVILINHDRSEAASFKRGDRIAQMVIQKVEAAQLLEVSELPGSGRGATGFGSSGK